MTSKLTDSTREPRAELHPALQDPPKAREPKCRMSPSQFHHRFARRRLQSSMKIESGVDILRHRLSVHGLKEVTDLCECVGERGGSNVGHTMDPSVARTCRLWLLLDRAGRGEDVLIALDAEPVSAVRLRGSTGELALMSSSFLNRPFHGFSGS